MAVCNGYSQKHYSGIADIGKLLQKNYKELYYMYKNAQKIKNTQLKTIKNLEGRREHKNN